MRYLFFLIGFLFFPICFSQVEENNQMIQNNMNIEILPDSSNLEEKKHLEEVIEAESPAIEKKTKTKDRKSNLYKGKKKKEN